MSRNALLIVCCAGAAVSAVASAGEPIPTVIYSEISTSDTSRVPGLVDARFDSFDRPYRSPDGRFWALTASSDLATSEDEVLISGANRMGELIAREGTAAPWAPGENIGLLNTRLSLNNEGDTAFGTNTDGPTGSDEYIVQFDASAAMYSALVQEGTPVPGIAGATHGSIIDDQSLQMTMGGPAYRTSLSNQPAGFGTNALILGPNVVANTDNTSFIPSGQAGGAMETWDNFDTGNYFASFDGNHWMAQGDLNGDFNSDDVLVVDNNVVIQEASTLSGFSSPVDFISESIMETNGDWYARGDNEDDQDWLLRNGDVVAKTGDAVPGGLAGETISDAVFGAAFFTMGGNNVGDVFWGATTSNTDEGRDAVIVVNDQVILRQGDAVDLDGNGMLDDGVFLDIFNNDDGFLTDDLKYYFTASLMDENGADLGQAFMRVLVPSPSAAAVFGLAGLAGLSRQIGRAHV